MIIFRTAIGLVLGVALSLPGNSHAATVTPESIAVIDVGVRSSLFASISATEVCILSSYKCPNGKSFMEGPGAADLPQNAGKDFNHGVQMISIINRVNPAAQVIPIRIVGATPNGLPSLYSLTDVQAAIKWIIDNREKYNIAAVNLAHGKVFPDCKVPIGLASQISTLRKFNVPVIVAVGNDGNRKSVMAPACLSETVSVGATDNPYPGMQPIAYDEGAEPYIARYSNGASGQTDFFTNARWFTTTLSGTKKFTLGTSNATAAISAFWLLNRRSNFDDTFSVLQAISSEVRNEFQSGRYIKIDSLSLGNNNS